MKVHSEIQPHSISVPAVRQEQVLKDRLYSNMQPSPKEPTKGGALVYMIACHHDFMDGKGFQKLFSHAN